MSTKTKRMLSFLLIFALVLQMLPMSAFAEGLVEAEGPALPITAHPAVTDSLYYRGGKNEYEADDVLWEIENERTETEKHFHMANGADIAVAYTYPVHYKDSDGKYQEIDNSLKVYNEDGTLSTAPVVSGLTKQVSAEGLFQPEPIATEHAAETPDPEAPSVEKQVPSEPTIEDSSAAEQVPSTAPEESASADESNDLSKEDFSDMESSIAEDPAEKIAVIESETAEEAAEVFEEDVSSVQEESLPDVLDEEVSFNADLPAAESSSAEDPSETIEHVDAVDQEVPEESNSELESVIEEAPVEETPLAEAKAEPVEHEASAAELEVFDAAIKELPIDTRVYKNNAGLADISLAVSGGSDKLATISYGDYSVSLTPQHAFDTRHLAEAYDAAVRVAAVAGQPKEQAPVFEKGSFEEKIIPKSLSSAITYDSILNGSDLEYILGETSLKENIIVKETADEYIYSFLLETGSLTPYQAESGSIELRNYNGDSIFVIPAGNMIDAKGESSMDVKYALESLGYGQYSLTVVADEEWMNAPGRAFPVTIDPPIYLQGFYNIETGTIREYTPDSYVGQVATESLGYYSANDGYCRMLVRVNNLPAVPDNSYIVNSSIHLYEVAYSHVGMSSLRVQAQALTDNFTTYGYWCMFHTWNDCPDLDSDVIDFTDVTNGRAFFGWNVTSEAIKWYNDPSCNYGICLRATKEGQMSSSSCANVGFCSSNTSNDAARPYFIVEYRNCIGLESYYSYQTHGIDRAGTGYIGDYSGQLTLVKDDVTAASTSNPVTISHVYNSGYANIGTSNAVHAVSGLYSSMGVGLGWMLNVQQSISPATNGYLMYIDGDGTAHYFYPSSSTVFKDEDGLGLTITKSGSNYTLKDRKDNISYFAGGMLNYMQDANGNRITIVRDSDDVILSVTRLHKNGSTETIASFTYNSAGNIGTMTDSANNVTRFYYDSNDRLTSITHPDGTTVTYTYDSACKLLSAKDDESGYSMNYEYNPNTGKVKKFYEMAGSTVGASVLSDGSFDGVQTYRYCGPDRQLNTADDIVSHSVLDYFGRTTSSYATNSDETLVYGASSTAYSQNNGTDATNNRALISCTTGVQSVNLLKYPSIENMVYIGSTPWTYSGGGSCGVSFEKARTGYRSMKITRAAADSTSVFAQTVNGLDADTWYVVSAYINTSSVTSFGNGDVTVKALGDSTYDGNYINWDTSSVSDGWERVYAVGKPSASGDLTLSVQISDIAGSIFVDDLQLEQSLFDEKGAPGSVSLLVNGAMTDSSTWSTWSSGNVGYVYDSLFGRVLHIQGDSYESIDVFQDVPVKQAGNQTYLLSGWARASAIPLTGSGYRSFSVWAEISYADNEGTTETQSVELNTDTDQWQYVVLPIVPKQPDLDVSGIRVYITFCREPNSAYFTNFSLTKEDAQSFKYNSNGDLISVASSENEQQNYSYSGADLITHATGGNGTISYEYDSKHNVTKATNDGLSMAVTHDVKGNTTGTTLSSTGTTSKITSSATYDSTGNRVLTQKDARGSTTTYSYDNNISKLIGKPTSVTDANNVSVDTFYNNANGRVDSVGMGYDVYLLYGYTGGRLTSLMRGGYAPDSSSEQDQTYTLGYNGFGNLTGISVGSRNLASYTYGSANGLLQELNYGNGDSVSYEYDKLERISNVYYNNNTSPSVSYSYSGNGGLSKVEDNVADKVTDYNYDGLGRLTSMTERHGEDGVQFYLAKYDGSNRVTQKGYMVSPAWNGTFRDGRIYGYTYNSANGSLSAMDLPANGRYSYTYDGLKRLTSRSLALNSSSFLTRNYTFVTGYGTNGTTMMVGGLTNMKGSTTLNNYTYTYDNVGNITAIGGSHPASYTYDSQGQLLTETVDGITYTYTYDTYGNLRSVNDGYATYDYTYGDSSWKDLLTAFCGYPISYDALGNPTTWYNNNTFTWVNGRRLSTVSNPYVGQIASYTYDANGLRQTKTVDNEEHRYVWQGNKLVSEYWDGEELEFFYDESGMPYAFSYKASASAAPVFYYYVTNLQGDVVKILNASGTTVADYSYNAWGKLLDSSGTMADVNPLRYRGYYFDAETGFYYVFSRYYDPEICRFINADDASNLGVNSDFASINLFAYCGNNPVNRADDGGDFWHIVVGAVIGGVIGAVSTAASGGDGIDIAIGFLAGAGGGALAASGAGVLIQAVGSAAIAMTSNLAQQANKIYISKKQESFDVGDMLIDGAVGLACGAWGGNGASYGNSNGIMAAGKRLFKRGFLDPQARSYYAKTAHRLGGDYVFKPLLESLGKTSVGSTIVTIKNIVNRISNKR